MSRWWRAHDDAVDNEKLLLLSDRQHRAWFGLMCLASANGGVLPAMKVIALKLRMTPAKATALLAELQEARLFDDLDDAIAPHNWVKRQFKANGSDATGAERQQRYRDRHRNAESNGSDGTVTVTPENRNREQKEDTASAASAKTYAFESGILRLTEKDFVNWQAAFSHLDLRGELVALAPWAEQQGPSRWFHAVANALNKRNREVKKAKDQGKTEPAFKWNGIEGVI